MIKHLFALLCVTALFAPFAGRAEQVVAAMSQSRISITANFDGSVILAFGAIKRDAPTPDTPLDIILTVSGPEQIEVIRRKARRAGIWVNVEAETLPYAPSFYTVASTGPLDSILPQETNEIWKITAEERILPNMRGEASREALMRLRRDDGLYSRREGTVDLVQETLFRTSLALPANLVEGDYTTRIFLLRDGSVVDSYATIIDVQKVGIERWLYNLAYNQALIYGLLSLALAAVSGWAASEIFRLLRR